MLIYQSKKEIQEQFGRKMNQYVNRNRSDQVKAAVKRKEVLGS